MYHENTETLSISLPVFFVHFINGYITTHENKSPSVVIQEALQLLYEREQRQTSHVIQNRHKWRTYTIRFGSEDA